MSGDPLAHHQQLRPTTRPQDDSRPPNAPPLLKPVLSANRGRITSEWIRVSTAVHTRALPVARRRAQRASTLPVMEAATSDVQLVARCADGDEGALAELYDRFGRAAYALALRIVRDATQAEDVVQEAFLDLWRSAARCLPPKASARSSPRSR